MKIVSWNVNSVKARLPNLLAYLQEAKPDVVCLQELKCVDEAFPRMEVEALGYNVETHGQKTYNGVALLSKSPLEDVTRGLPNFEDEQSRYIEAVVSTDKGAVRPQKFTMRPLGFKINSRCIAGLNPKGFHQQR